MKGEMKVSAIHHKCLECQHYQQPKQHGSVVDYSTYDVEWIEHWVPDRKNPREKMKILIQKYIPKGGRKHFFKLLKPRCAGLNLQGLEKADYPHIKCPPCWVKIREEQR